MVQNESPSIGAKGERRVKERGERRRWAGSFWVRTLSKTGIFDLGIKVILNLIKSINDRASQENSQINYFHSSRG